MYTAIVIRIIEQGLLYICRNVCPKERPRFSVIIKRLCAKDEEILHDDDDKEETCTNLGDVLTASFDLYKDLQLTYCSNNIVKCY